MTAPVVDLPRVRAALRALDVHVSGHPHLTGNAARERCSEWLAGEEPDENVVDLDTEAPDERPASAERRPKRPTTRGD